MDIDDMVEEAKEAMSFSYSPYSKFKVGAAVLASGKVFTGCNIENASYGLSICAERVALFKAISEGYLDIEAIAIYGEKMPYPCGACLQVMTEFCKEDCRIIISDGKNIKIHKLGELLPFPFSKDTLKLHP